MRYFELLNLRREPFSNSPDPDLFHRTKQHRECLQALEIAIRLKRGLSVVTGHVGTGKTTLCRQLIRVLAERQGVVTHLILDPFFTDGREFLVHLNVLFGVEAEQTRLLSDWELRENIKAALFRLAVEEERLVALIVDEGQKMSLECLEILRELLNFETNEHKLLQIVIFGQLEFEPILEAKANLADRVNLRFRLGPLDFQDTRELIQARLAMCAKDISPEGLFTFWALLAVYLATDGFPRQIVQLCHQTLLAVIIKEKPRATWSLVRSCMRWRTLGLPRRRRWPRTLALAALVLAVLAGGGAYFALGPQVLEAPARVVRQTADAAAALFASSRQAPEQAVSSAAPGAASGQDAVSGAVHPASATPAQADASAGAPEGPARAHEQFPPGPPAGSAPGASGTSGVLAASGAEPGHDASGHDATAQPGQDSPAPDAQAARAEGRAFTGVRVVPCDDGECLELLTTAPVERFEASLKSGPSRLVVDIAGQWARTGEREQAVGSGRIDKVRNAVHPDKLRVAIYLKDAPARTVRPAVEKTPQGLKVILK